MPPRVREIVQINYVPSETVCTKYVVGYLKRKLCGATARQYHKIWDICDARDAHNIKIEVSPLLRRCCESCLLLAWHKNRPQSHK